MWIRKITRERNERKRKKAVMATRKWQEAKRERQMLEDKLGRVKKKLAPAKVENIYGIHVAIHKTRRYREEYEYRFEFFRQEGTSESALSTDYGEQDLDALLEAVYFAKKYRKHFASENGSQKNGSERRRRDNA